MHGLDGAVFLMFTQIAITIIEKKKKIEKKGFTIGSCIKIKRIHE